jgi:hypothetical protein
MLRRIGFLRSRIFKVTLPEVVSRHYHEDIFGDKQDPA